MKLLIDASRNEIQNPSGTSLYSREVINHLLPFLKQQEVTLASRASLKDPQYKPYKNRVFGPPILWSLIGLSIEQGRNKYDGIFIPAHVLPLLHAPATVVVHDVAFMKFPSAYSIQSRLYLRWSTKRLVNRARKVICISETTKNDLVELFHADASKLEVISPGYTVPPEAHVDTQDQAELFRQLRLTAGEYLIFIGRVEEKKNVARLLAAFNATVKAHNLSHKLVLVGAGGVGKEKILSQIKQLEIEDRVVMTDHIADVQKWQLLRGASALVFPSLYEGFGYPILEAFAADIPVLTSSVASMPEVAGDAAVFVDPLNPESIGKGLETVLTDKTLRSSLVQKGRERLQLFNWDRQASLIAKTIVGKTK